MRVSLNRNLSSIARASTRISNYNSDERKARTRTLIQAGGLLSLSGLLQKCGIVEGEDLQLDFHAKEKSETLLGILLEAAHQISEEQDDVQMEKFRTLGRVFMKRSNTITANQQRRWSIKEIKYDKILYQKAKVKMEKTLACKKCFEKRIKDSV